MRGFLLTSTKPVSLPLFSLSLRLCLHIPLINSPHIPPHWYFISEERNTDFQNKNMQMRTALPQSSQISWTSLLWQPVFIFFSGECKAAKPHCRTMAIKTNNVAIEIATLATVSPALLSAELSWLCCKWDKLSNRQMAQNQNTSFLLDKLFIYIGIRCYARSALTVVLNNLLLFIKGCVRLHSTRVRKHFNVLFSRMNTNISSSLSLDPEKGFTYKEAHSI